MSIRKGTSIIAGNVAQNVDQSLSLVSNNPVKNSAITEELQKKLSTGNITNCLTHIPQDIKLEIDDSKALILKAGSKFYYPKGLSSTTPVFGSFTTTSDLTLNVGAADHTNIPHFICVTSDGTSSVACTSSDVYSSGIAPTAQNALWYDTGNNVIRSTTNGGTTWSSTPLSFPICIAINTAGKCEEIKQTFNGFGYIGSIVFALPGVKGLIPDGRNADGSLKNINTNDFITVKTVQVNTSTAKIAMYSGGGLGSQTKNFGLNEPENYNYDSGILTNALEVASVIVDSSAKITAFTSKTEFHAVDYSDTEHIAHQAMPSDRYIDLTLGASGAAYTAPADGWFISRQEYNNGYYQVDIVGKGIVQTNTSQTQMTFMVPVRKGQVIKYSYSNLVPTDYGYFRFLYANGSK